MKIMVEMIGECVNVRTLDLGKALFRSASLYFLAYDFGVKDRKGCESRGHNGVRFKPFVLIYGFGYQNTKGPYHMSLCPCNSHPLSILLTF